ncbi:hypothetical protein JCM21714_3857 [Gracilibacillus boraciitolerans JCM 21714]|uniref:Uncharacterized protein n=1 Tax=Gracilibacillus boraciitolerans JCM 21714 TaxID=1298598 RepID=W4VNA6_9BACI|nr:hypothetical protein [Gracilibacillus boraciitolerans]GAE94677.1 hypothetical protein JCM21714_3857 [Gracilibacillus boraciitolerans JCM 21714]
MGLDDYSLDKAERVESFYVKNLELAIQEENILVKEENVLKLSFSLMGGLRERPSMVFKELAGIIVGE